MNSGNVPDGENTPFLTAYHPRFVDRKAENLGLRSAKSESCCAYIKIGWKKAITTRSWCTTPMSKEFVYRLKGEPEEMFGELSKLASENGWDLQGNADRGRFSGLGGALLGHYEVRGNDLSIVIESKPLIAPWSMIENKLDSYFG